MLRIQLENSVKSDENGCPVFSPEIGVTALHEYAAHGEEAVKKFSKYYIRSVGPVAQW